MEEKNALKFSESITEPIDKINSRNIGVAFFCTK